MRARDKVVIVTGGGSGIGQAYALALAKEGAKVVVSGRRLSRLEETVRTIRDAGGCALAVRADVTEREEVENLVQTALKEFGRIDCLVNNAGIYPSGYRGILEQDEDKWMYIFMTDVDGRFRCAQAVARALVKQGSGGSIITVGSVSTFRGASGGWPYTAATGALLGMTRCMAMELAPYHIRVNLVGMGITHTGALEELSGGAAGLDLTAASVPLGRASYPEDTSPIVLWLCSDESEYVTGESIIADGGWIYTHWLGGVELNLAAYRAKPKAL